MPIAFLFTALALQAAASEPITVTGRRPWAPFISPMGEPFRARSEGDDTIANWFRQADGDADGILSPAELDADAVRFFNQLDADRNGAILPEEMVSYEFEVAPEIQVNSRWRPRHRESEAERRKRERRSDGYNAHGLQGAARYALLNIPQPVASADTDFDRAITLVEFRQAAAHRFALLDRKTSLQLRLADLRQLLPDPKEARRRHKPRKDERDPRIGTPVPL